MKSFTLFERRLAKYLSSFPQVKKYAKKVYQYISYYATKNNNKCITNSVIKDYGTIGFESFFGYYDKCPINPQSNLLLWHETDLDTRMPPDPSHPVKIIISDIKGRIIKEYCSNAYNWQQGSRLHWYDKNVFCFLKITAAATTGPAQGPRPTSSVPATKEFWIFSRLKIFSIISCIFY